MKSFSKKLRGAPKRSLEVLRNEGVRSLCFRVLGETVYRRAWVWERVLNGAAPEKTCRLAVETRLLASSELDEYDEFCAERESLDSGSAPGLSEIRRRLNAGQLCFIARCQGRIVSSAWMALGRAWIDYLACEVLLAPDDAYLYESYTLPDYRGRGVPTERSRQEVEYLRRKGCRRMIAVISPENRAAVRHAERAGWKPLGVMGCVKLGPWRRLSCRLKEGHAPLVIA
jgi:GNAT superfamily N-acetyltransferase